MPTKGNGNSLKKGFLKKKYSGFEKEVETTTVKPKQIDHKIFRQGRHKNSRKGMTLLK